MWQDGAAFYQMRHTFWLSVGLLASAWVVVAQPQFRNAGALLVGETSVNNAIEHGETVTVSLALKYVGDQVASNLVATIQAGNGVSNPSPASRDYGTLVPGAESVARSFTFTCTAPSNSLLLVRLDLVDGAQSLGTVTFRFRVVGTQDFHAENPDAIDLNPVGPAAIFPSVLGVSNVIGTIFKVSVTLSNLSHTFPDDLDILLVSPSGDRVLLMSDACGGSDLENVTLTFTDDAPGNLPDTGFPNSLVVRPTNLGIPDLFPLPTPAGPYAAVMSAFNGKDANGDWRLYIMDDANDDGGRLNAGWSLTLTTIPSAGAAPAIIPIGLSANNTIRFAVSGSPGYSYAIESAPDPLQSFPLESFIMPLSGVRIFEYPISPENRFFRAATDP